MSIWHKHSEYLRTQHLKSITAKYDVDPMVAAEQAKKEWNKYLYDKVNGKKK